MIPATSNDTSAFFGSNASTDVPRDQWGRYELPDPRTGEQVDGWTRATTFAATLAEQFGLTIWKQRQVVWGLSRRPDLITLASTISGPEDKKALGGIVDEAHIAAGTDAKANRGTAIHRACQASEAGRHHEVPEELRPHVAGYFTALKTAGLQVVPDFVERVIIVDRYHVAGQLDNLVMCPDGKLRVLDKKTGNLDYADIEFAVQLALYAHADATFNYATGRYEPMPEVATDYAIIAHIDPETGKTELSRVNIEWGWLWARTCAEVMDIRKTKSVITPYVPATVVESTIFAPRADFVPATQPQTPKTWVPEPTLVPASHADQYAAAQFAAVTYPGPPAPHVLPPNVTSFAQNSGPAFNNTSISSWSHTVPIPADNADTSAYWLDEDDAPGATMNGVPVTQYGQPSQHPCAVGQTCEFTGQDGLHRDGTVCLYGNARPGPVPVVPGEEVRWDNTGTLVVLRAGQWVPGAEQTLEQAAPPLDGYMTGDGPVIMGPAEVVHTPPSPNETAAAVSEGASTEVLPDDDTVAKVMKAHKDKAAMQKLATQVMQQLGIKEGDPDGIRLAQYKADLASAIVTLAYTRGVEVPGIGRPTGPGHPKKQGKAAKPAKKSGDTEAEQAVAKEHAAAVRTAVLSIQQQHSIEGLTRLHDHYANNTRVGWTDEMQVAARTRAAELDAATGAEVLTPEQMIDGATSMETLSKAYQIATNGGQNLAGWTAELDAKAQTRHGELQQLAMSVNQ
jgi:hypothetical protein